MPEDTGLDEEWLEAGRKAYELNRRHPQPYLFAAKMAARTLKTGDEKEHAFWEKVAGTLRPRV
jgi:hypothetical protein